MSEGIRRIVITGSTRGLGRGLAEELLARDCAVVICGRSQESVAAVVAELGERFGASRVHGQAGDVTSLPQVEALWEGATARFGGVDIWVNNAGISHAMQPLWELPPDEVEGVWRATAGQLLRLPGGDGRYAGQGQGWIYNVEGFGSTGRLRWGLGAYGTSKAAVAYFTRALAAEAQETPVRVASLSPGMVMTDLVLGELAKDPERLERSRRIFNIIADRAETVTPWMAEQILSNQRHGARIRWLTPGRMAWRFLSAPFSHRNVFDD